MNNYILFLKATPFLNLGSVLLKFFMNQVSNVAYVLLNTYMSIIILKHLLYLGY